MKTIKNKEILVGADFAGFPLKEAVVEHLEKKGWRVTDVVVRKDSNPDDTDLMFAAVLPDKACAFAAANSRTVSIRQHTPICVASSSSSVNSVKLPRISCPYSSSSQMICPNVNRFMIAIARG